MTGKPNKLLTFTVGRHIDSPVYIWKFILLHNLAICRLWTKNVNPNRQVSRIDFLQCSLKNLGHFHNCPSPCVSSVIGKTLFHFATLTKMVLLSGEKKNARYTSVMLLVFITSSNKRRKNGSYAKYERTRNLSCYCKTCSSSSFQGANPIGKICPKIV